MPDARIFTFLDKVVEIGDVGEIVNVNDGYACGKPVGVMTATDHYVSAELIKLGRPG